jgi:hypothetical protein
MATLEVLEPVGQVRELAPVQLNAVGSLAGRRLAILDNGKPNFRLLATLVAERLQADEGVASIAHFAKENAAVGAMPELLDRIAQSADVVLTGSAD